MTTATCPQGHPVAEGVQVCTTCGSPVASPLSSCLNGHGLPAGARSCGLCGAPAAGAEAAPPPPPPPTGWLPPGQAPPFPTGPWPNQGWPGGPGAHPPAAAPTRARRWPYLVALLSLVLVAAAAAVVSRRGGDSQDPGTAGGTTLTTAAAGTGPVPTEPTTVADRRSVPPVPAGRAISGPTPCPRPTGEKRASSFEQPPPQCIDPAKSYGAVFSTSAGVVKVSLDTRRTPLTANNFIVLARYGYYDGTSFDRTDPAIDIIQGGSPATQSISDPGPGYTINDEGGKFTYSEGDLVMARTQGPDSASAQYFFSAGPKTSNLDAQGTYVTFGRASEGLDVLKRVLASHVRCFDSDPRSGCLGGAPRPPVVVTSVSIEET